MKYQMILLSVIGCFCISFALYKAVTSFLSSKKTKWLDFTSACCIAVGSFGFFGSGFVGVGGARWLPSSFEWPVGDTDSIIETSTNYIVLHHPSGRIQIYEKSWKFIRGWYVEGDGGDFKAKVDSLSHIEVWTARQEQRYLFTIEGKLISSGSFSPQSYEDFHGGGRKGTVPTSMLLYIFASPIVAGFLFFFGIILGNLSEWVISKENLTLKYPI